MSPRIALLFSLLAAGPLAAQSWDGLQSFHGQQIKVLETAGQERKGVLDSLTPSAVTLSNGSKTTTIERARVRRVQVRSGNRRARNFVIGVAIGVAVAVTIDQTLGTYLRNETGDSGRAVTYIAPIAVFGGLGAAFPGYRTVYRVR